VHVAQKTKHFKYMRRSACDEFEIGLLRYPASTRVNAHASAILVLPGKSVKYSLVLFCTRGSLTVVRSESESHEFWQANVTE
jgi:hypothetical protein